MTEAGRQAGAHFFSVSKSVFSFFFCPSHKLVTEGVKGSDLGHMSKMGQEILLICDLSLVVLWLKNLKIILERATARNKIEFRYNHI